MQFFSKRCLYLFIFCIAVMKLISYFQSQSNELRYLGYIFKMLLLVPKGSLASWRVCRAGQIPHSPSLWNVLVFVQQVALRVCCGLDFRLQFQPDFSLLYPVFLECALYIFSQEVLKCFLVWRCLVLNSRILKKKQWLL